MNTPDPFEEYRQKYGAAPASTAVLEPAASAPDPFESYRQRFGAPAPQPAPEAARGGDPASATDRMSALVSRGEAAGQMGSDTILAPPAEPTRLPPVVVEERGTSTPRIDTAAGGGTWEEPSTVASGFRSGMAMGKGSAGQMLQAAGSTAGVDRLVQLGDEISAAAQVTGRSNAPRVGDIRQIGTIDDALDWAAWNIGQGAASTLAPLIGGLAGGAAGGPAGAMLGAAGPSFGLMFGEVRQALQEEGVTDPETLNNWAAIAAIPMTALETVVPGQIGGRLTGGGRREVARGLVRRITGEAATSAAQEGATEVGQEAIQTGVVSGVADKPIDSVETLWQLINAGAAGAASGAAMGGASGLAPDRVAPQESGISDIENSNPPPAPVDPLQEFARRNEEIKAQSEVERAAPLAIEEELARLEAAAKPEPVVVPVPVPVPVEPEAAAPPVESPPIDVPVRTSETPEGPAEGALTEAEIDELLRSGEASPPRREAQTATFHMTRGGARTLSDEALLERYRAALRESTIAGAGADDVQGKGGRIKRDYADGETAIGMVGTGVGKFERGRYTQAEAKLLAFEEEIRSREGLTLPSVEQAFVTAREREIPKDLRPEFAELRQLDDEQLLERWGMADENAASERGNPLAQVRRAMYAGEAERRGFALEDGVDVITTETGRDDDLPFDRSTDRISRLRREAERQAERDPTTRRLHDAVRSTAPGRSSGRTADAAPDAMPPRYQPRRGGTTPVSRPSSTYVEQLTGEAKPATQGTRTLHPISPVELTRMATELLGDKAPFLKRYPSARGMMYPDPADPKIGINPELGRDYQQFAKTLAHEVGHLVDFLSDRDLKRGNILGRIASLKEYLAHTIDEAPTDPSRALTPQDRRRLRREAEARSGPRPSKESTDDLASWQDEVAERYSDLLKEEIASRGLLERERMTEELIGLSEWWRPYDRATAPASFIAYRESSIELYADALSALLNNPGALQERAPAFFDAFFAYLGRKPEAQSSYDAVQDILTAGEEAVHTARRSEIEKDFERGEDIQRNAEDKKDPQSMGAYLKQLLVDRAAPVVGAEQKRVGKAAPAHSDQHAVKMALQELNHADNVNRLMLMAIEENVHRPLMEAEITDRQAGTYLMLQRIAEGDRGGMAEQAKEAIMEATGHTTWEEARGAYAALEAQGTESGIEFDPALLELADSGVLNPHGYTPAEAKRTLDGLKEELGAEKFETLSKLMSRLRRILWRSVEEAARVGSYNREVFNSKLVPNRKTYAPFAVLDYFNGRMAAGVKGQMGTLKGIANPYTTAILKAMTLNRLNEHQKAKQAVLGVIDVDFPGMAGPEQAVDKYRREKKPGPDRENITYLVDGKLHYREVDAYIAKVFEKTDLGNASRFFETLNSFTYQVFHPLYVTLSLGWQARNVPRDWKRTFKNLSAAHAGKPTYRQAIDSAIDVVQLNAAYLGTARDSWRHARRQHVPMIKEMLKDRALGRAFHSFNPRAQDVKYDRLMQEYGIRPPSEGGLRAWAQKVGRGVETVGVFQETWSKAAAYRVLGERGIRGRERAYIVRNYTGTPDSSNRGLGAEIPNSLWMYFNVIVAGWRADMEVATQPSTAAGYWFRTVMVDVAPKLAMAAAVMGFFGDDIEEWWKHVPSYDKEKYTIIPLPPFYSENEFGEKKAVYLRFPHDDVTRVMVGAMWALLMSEGPGRVSRSIGLVAGEFPGLNPAIDIPLKWAQAATGRNPYDSFRGRDVVPRTEWDAGGWKRWKEMGRWTLGQLGIVSQLLGRFTYASPEEGRTTPLEGVMRSIPGLSSVVTVSDRGLSESRYADEDWETKERAQLRADLSRDVRRATSERGQLNRFGVERLSPAERRRRAQLNTWYRRYLRETAAMEQARDAGDTNEYNRIRDRLSESVPPRQR